MTKQNYAKSLILCSFFAALTGIFSIISIPLPFSPVPVNLALLSVYLAGGLLGSKSGAISQLVYVLLGAIGLPVFHNLTGGLSILLGPTGGFLIGYIAAAFLVGFFYERSTAAAEAALPTRSTSTAEPAMPTGSASPTKGLIIGMLTGLTACYSLGTLWFIYISGANLQSALLLCVIPFLPGDAFKMAAAFFLIRKLHPIIRRTA